MKLQLGLALLATALLGVSTQAAQLISNPGIEGTSGDNPLLDIHVRNSWNGIAAEVPAAPYGRWWTGASGDFGHEATGGNGGGYFDGNNNGFINRFQIVDNTTTQASGPAVFSVDRRWYDDDPSVGNTFLGVKWRIYGINGESNLPPNYGSMTSGSNFGLNGGTGDLLAEYNFNDINGTSPAGDGISDTGAMGTEWHTQVTDVDLGASPYDYFLVIFRAGSTNLGDVEVPVGFDNVTLTTVPEPAGAALGAVVMMALSGVRRRGN